jgi:hypothetical protein
VQFGGCERRIYFEQECWRWGFVGRGEAVGGDPEWKSLCDGLAGNEQTLDDSTCLAAAKDSSIIGNGA